MSKIVKIFHRQTNRQTDRPTNLPPEAPPRSLKNYTKQQFLATLDIDASRIVSVKDLDLSDRCVSYHLCRRLRFI